MSDDTKAPPKPEKRTDVGYKRPPPEHQFKAGQKPPPRRKRTVKTITPRELLWRILRERRQVQDTDGKTKWMTAGEIVIRNAFALAEQGNLSIKRMLDRVLLQGPDNEAEPAEPKVVLKPDSKHTGVVTRRRAVKS